MVLKPVALIDGIVTDVGVVEGVEFDEEATVLEARRGKRCAIREGDSYQSPLAGGRVPERVRDEEELVGRCDDVRYKRAQGRGERWAWDGQRWWRAGVEIMGFDDLVAR